MQDDPRFHNQLPGPYSGESPNRYFSDYCDTLQASLKAVSAESIDAAAQAMREVRNRKGRIFAGGNGGSAAISEHLSCDWQKGVHLRGLPCLKVHCLTSNTALFTAIANDFGYAQTFAYQLELAELNADDLIILISSSGNSENVVQAAQYARGKQCKVIALTGFSGGKLKEAADISLHVPFSNYGVVEDCHQTLMHCLAQYHDLKTREGL